MYFSAILDFAKRLPISRHPWSRKSQAMNLMEQQGNKIKEIGFLLKEARTQNAVSLEELASQTLVRVGLLSAIENGNLKELPEPIYVQAIIRQYANFLGLDGDKLADSIPTKQLHLQKDQGWNLFLPMITQLRPMHLYAIYIVLMVIAVNSLSAIVDNSKQDNAPIALPPIQEKVTSTPPTNTKIATIPSPSPKPSQPIVVNVTLKSQSWLRVIADEQMLFEGVLDEGNQRTWTAQQKLSLRAGNAGALVVAFNENSPKSLGNLGEVQEITFTPETKPQVDSNSPNANSPTTNFPTTNSPTLNQSPPSSPTPSQTPNESPNQR